MPVKGLIWLSDKIFMILFDFILKTKTGLFILIMTILVIGFFEYKKKTQT
jgi:hypothetical protein